MFSFRWAIKDSNRLFFCPRQSIGMRPKSHILQHCLLARIISGICKVTSYSTCQTQCPSDESSLPGYFMRPSHPGIFFSQLHSTKPSCHPPLPSNTVTVFKRTAFLSVAPTKPCLPCTYAGTREMQMQCGIGHHVVSCTANLHADTDQ